jgi:hypothetical protein
MKTGEHMRKVVTAALSLMILASMIFKPVTAHAQQLVSNFDEAFILYLPFVENQLWGTEVDDWYIIDIHTENNVDYFAVLATKIGWVVQTKNIQLFDPLMWIVPYQGQRCIWEGFYFFCPSSSWHPPYYMDLAVIKIIGQPVDGYQRGRSASP